MASQKIPWVRYKPPFVHLLCISAIDAHCVDELKRRLRESQKLRIELSERMATAEKERAELEAVVEAARELAHLQGKQAYPMLVRALSTLDRPRKQEPSRCPCECHSTHRMQTCTLCCRTNPSTGAPLKPAPVAEAEPVDDPDDPNRCQGYLTCDAASDEPEDHHHKCPMFRDPTPEVK